MALTSFGRERGANVFRVHDVRPKCGSLAHERSHPFPGGRRVSFVDFTTFADAHWRDAVEILLLAVSIYYVWLFFKGTPGANVLVGLVVVFLAATLISRSLGLIVIGSIFESLSKIVVLAMVVIFQPELRRGLAALGGHRIFFAASQSRETLDLVCGMTFDLANRQLGALIALERGQNLENIAESGVKIDCALSTELAVSIFFPKTPLHDGGIIIQNDRIVSAACIFPADATRRPGPDAGPAAPRGAGALRRDRRHRDRGLGGNWHRFDLSWRRDRKKL